MTIEFTGSYHALQQAIRATAYASRVVVCGFFQGEAVGLALGEEFHHNCVELVWSQISGVAPRLAPRLAHRWTRRRLETTVCALQADARLDLGGLISHVVPFREAASAYQLLDEHPDYAVQVVLQF